MNGSQPFEGGYASAININQVNPTFGHTKKKVDKEPLMFGQYNVQKDGPIDHNLGKGGFPID